MTRRNPYPQALNAAERTYEINEVAKLTASPLRDCVRGSVAMPWCVPPGCPMATGPILAEQVALLRAFARLIDAGERIGDLADEGIEEVLARASSSTWLGPRTGNCSRPWWRTTATARALGAG
jgi:hypothetical protein